MVDNCPICLMKLKKDFGCIVPCGHCVHVQCFQEYIQNHDKKLITGLMQSSPWLFDAEALVLKCPTCRSGISTFQRVYLTLEDSRATSSEQEDNTSECHMVKDCRNANYNTSLDSDDRSRSTKNADDSSQTNNGFPGFTYQDATSTLQPHRLGQTIPFSLHLNNVFREWIEQSTRINMVQQHTMLVQREINRAHCQLIEQVIISDQQGRENLLYQIENEIELPRDFS